MRKFPFVDGSVAQKLMHFCPPGILSFRPSRVTLILVRLWLALSELGVHNFQPEKVQRSAPWCLDPCRLVA